eukprot:6487919-Karenia_brevis.AAC.1
MTPPVLASTPGLRYSLNAFIRCWSRAKSWRLPWASNRMKTSYCRACPHPNQVEVSTERVDFARSSSTLDCK